MRYIDDDSKKLYWWNRNYFFAGTLFICLFTILLYMNTRSVVWFYELGGFMILKGVVSFFVHTTLQHVLLNMLCLLICGAWLERRKGTLEFLGLLCVMLLLIHLVEATTSGRYNYNLGFSPVNFGLYAYAIVDYCFLFQKPTRTKMNVISGAILVGLIYFASCFDGGRISIHFQWYPIDLWEYNLGYFFAGAILGLTIQLAKLAAIREKCTESPSYYVCKRFFPAQKYRNYQSIGLDRDEIVTVDTAFFPPDEWRIFTEYVELAKDEQVLAVLKLTDDIKLPALDEFEFCGFDLVQEGEKNHNLSVLMNSSRYFSELLTPNILNQYGLLESLKATRRIQKDLSDQYDYCEIYAIWRRTE